MQFSYQKNIRKILQSQQTKNKIGWYGISKRYWNFRSFHSYWDPYDRNITSETCLQPAGRLTIYLTLAFPKMGFLFSCLSVPDAGSLNGSSWFLDISENS